eukprot:RCo014758
MTTLAAITAVEMCRQFIPRLSTSGHKGSSGRVGVIGGSEEYTGAPYFSAMTTLRLGVDLAFVYCHPDAAVPIKSLAPDLMVIPALRNPSPQLTEETIAEELATRISSLHALVVGPGLGRSEATFAIISRLFRMIRERKLKLPIVIDADGLWIITQHPALIRDLPYILLTPNQIELRRLCNTFNVDFPMDFDSVPQRSKTIMDLAAKFGNNLSILSKGRYDVIANADGVRVCSEPFTTRRVGGQGDVLSGAAAAFLAWAHLLPANQGRDIQLDQFADACFSAAFFTRCSAYKAWQQRGRNYLTHDVLECMGSTFRELFPEESSGGEQIDLLSIKPFVS